MTLPELKDFRERLIMAHRLQEILDTPGYNLKYCCDKYALPWSSALGVWYQPLSGDELGQREINKCFALSLANIDRMIAKAERIK